MPSFMVGCLFRSQEKGDLKKWDFFQGDGLSFSQKAGFEKNRNSAPSKNVVRSPQRWPTTSNTLCSRIKKGCALTTPMYSAFMQNDTLSPGAYVFFLLGV
jgi:hypothetical protein